MRGACAALAAATGIALVGCGGGGGGGASSTSSSAAVTSTTISDHATPTTTSAGPVPNTTVAPAVRLARGFRLTSPAFRQNGPIPKRYTCDGTGVSPPLRFSGIPRATRELVLIMRDPDAP